MTPEEQVDKILAGLPECWDSSTRPHSAQQKARKALLTLLAEVRAEERKRLTHHIVPQDFTDPDRCFSSLAKVCDLVAEAEKKSLEDKEE